MTAAALAATARRLFTDGPPAWRLLQIYRPYICPFDVIIDAVPQGARVLDIGCGGGLLLGLLAAAGRIGGGIGFDTSVPAVELARGMAGRSFPGRLDFEALAVQDSWPEGTFDVVTAIDVLHHVPPSAQAGVVAQAAAKVRPGGLLLVKDMVTRPWWRAAANHLHDLVLARQWIHTPEGGDIVAWAGAAGLVLERERIDNVLWYGHRLQVFRKGGVAC